MRQREALFGLTDTENRLAVAKGSRGGEGWRGGPGFGISRCKLSYTEQANNKVLLFSSGNYIQ